jgi:hypothetical protein
LEGGFFDQRNSDVPVLGMIPSPRNLSIAGIVLDSSEKDWQIGNDHDDSNDLIIFNQ